MREVAAARLVMTGCDVAAPMRSLVMKKRMLGHAQLC
jgi:hypothetical protein